MTHKRVIEVFAKLVGKRLGSSCPGGIRPSISGQITRASAQAPAAGGAPTAPAAPAGGGGAEAPVRSGSARASLAKGPATPQGYRYLIALRGVTARRRVTPGRRPRRIFADVSWLVSVRVRVAVIARCLGGAFAAR